MYCPRALPVGNELEQLGQTLRFVETASLALGNVIARFDDARKRENQRCATTNRTIDFGIDTWFVPVVVVCPARILARNAQPNA